MLRKPFAWLAEAPQVAPPFAMPMTVQALPELPQAAYSARVTEPLLAEEDAFLKLQQKVSLLCQNLQHRMARLQQQIVQAKDQVHLQTHVAQWEQEVVVLQALLPQLLNTIK